MSDSELLDKILTIKESRQRLCDRVAELEAERDALRKELEAAQRVVQLAGLLVGARLLGPDMTEKEIANDCYRAICAYDELIGSPIVSSQNVRSVSSSPSK